MNKLTKGDSKMTKEESYVFWPNKIKISYRNGLFTVNSSGTSMGETIPHISNEMSFNRQDIYKWIEKCFPDERLESDKDRVRGR